MMWGMNTQRQNVPIAEWKINVITPWNMMFHILRPFGEAHMYMKIKNENKIQIMLGVPRKALGLEHISMMCTQDCGGKYCGGEIPFDWHLHGEISKCPKCNHEYVIWGDESYNEELDEWFDYWAMTEVGETNPWVVRQNRIDENKK